MRTREVNLKVWAATFVGAVAAAMVLTLALGMESARAAFPGSNGAWIAFRSDLQIHRMASDGSGSTRLSDTTGIAFAPAWSADGKKIAFEHFNASNSEIYWMNANGSVEVNLTRHPESDLDPSFFPNYRKIAFTSGRDGDDYDIFRMTVSAAGDIITDGPTRLTTSRSNDLQSAVSPDGKKIAFVSDRDGDFDIYVMKASAPEGKTNRPVKLTRNSTSDTEPEWAPDGKKIAFVSFRSGNSEIYVMEPGPESRTNRPRNLTRDTAEDSAPAFSPDGRKIVFSRERGSAGDIFKMNADGSNPVNLTNSSSVHETTPSWQPDP